MSLPILLSYSPSAWRDNDLRIQLRAFQDRAKKIAVPLTSYGDTWTATVHESFSTALVVASFTVDATMAEAGSLLLVLPAATLALLPKPNYVFKVTATGGASSPVTVFRGRFSLDGN